MSRWIPYVQRVTDAANGIGRAPDLGSLLNRAMETITAAEDVRDLALLAARDDNVPWSHLAEITGLSSTGVRHAYSRAAARFRDQVPQTASLIEQRGA